MGTTVSEKWGKEYLDVFKGIVSMPAYMSRSLIDFAHAIKVLIANETEKHLPDNHLISLLIDAARLGYEQITWAYSDPGIEGTQDVPAEVETVYQEFWKDIIEKNGTIDHSQVKKELFDFHTAMKEVSVVYMHLTNGQISKITTPHQVIIDAVEKQSLPDPPSESDDSCSPTEGLVCQTCGNPLVEVETVYPELWKVIIEKNGTIDHSQVKKELFDFRTAMKEVRAVYMHLTNGQISKITTPHQVIIDAVEKQSLPDPPSESDDSCSPTEGLVCQTCGNPLVVLATETTEYGKLKTILMECSGCKEESTLTVRHKWGVVDYE